MSRLRISEIFYSLQGESRSAGFPTVFVRLTGCPLRCGYCDTTYAFKGGEWMELPDICEQVAAYQPRHVTVTGGEPLAQKAVLPLLNRLCDADYEVSLETSGSLDLHGVDSRVVTVMDIKTPGSGEAEKNRWENLQQLSPQDQIKFVICNREDYDWAKAKVREHELPERLEVIFSPAQGQLAPAMLADWILQDKLPVRFQLQLHKILWGDEPGR
ncbi:7-carboxy-7-deazaguanine synthase QueE [Thiolapillus sp.]